ncbi:asparaginase [PVC group bacterium]|nr:asparaginase [PVC group bacterium]
MVNHTVARTHESRSVVVTHGTDTVARGAYFLDVTLTSDKAVVFSGAMNDAPSPHPDWPGNNAGTGRQSDSSHSTGIG